MNEKMIRTEGTVDFLVLARLRRWPRRDLEDYGSEFRVENFVLE
jgi:hypothetical protein